MTKRNFFNIQSVVVVWATQKLGKIGNELIKNLENFEWEVYGLNPKWGNFMGRDFYSDYSKLPQVPDIAVFVIPAKGVCNSLEEAGKFGIKRAIIISAWFKEVGNTQWEEKVKEIAKKYSISILGPNCLGYIDTKQNLNLSFGTTYIKPGNIAMISQSWAMAVALMDWAYSTSIWFSKVITLWNTCDLNEVEILTQLAFDDNTKVVVMYLESIEQWKKLIEVACKINKPIVLLKSGVSKKGQQAASSHTWALAGDRDILEVACKKAGIYLVDTISDLMYLWEYFSLHTNKNIEDLIVITNAGGPWVISIDAAEKYNVSLASFDSQQEAVLRVNIPDAASVHNPIDIIGDATSQRYLQILENIKNLNEKFSLLFLLTPQSITDCYKVAKVIYDWSKENPQYFVATSFIWWVSLEESKKYFLKRSILHFDDPDYAMRFIGKIQYKSSNNKICITKVVQKINKSFDFKNQSWICDVQLTHDILNAYSIPTIKEDLVTSINQAKNIYNWNALVAKISSWDIPHKTDIWWIIMDIDSQEKAIASYKHITQNAQKFCPQAKIDGILYQEIFSGAHEIFIWLKRDPVFWDTLILGMWGIYVNVYEDVARTLLPTNKETILELLESLKGYPILNGARWKKKVYFDTLGESILKLTQLFSEVHEIKEIDVNPLLVNDKKALIVDIKLYL